MGAQTDIERRRGSYISDQLVKLVMGFVLFTSTSLSAWALYSVFRHEGRIIRLETRGEANSEKLAEMGEKLKEIDEKLADIRDRLPRKP